MDPIDPIDPAFLERTFANQISGPARVERVRELHDDQPGEEQEDDEQPHNDEGRTHADEDSVVVELDHTEQEQPDAEPDDDSGGPHIDISV